MSKTLQQMAAVVRRARVNNRCHKTGATRRELVCDVLEDRQLLSSAGGHFGLGLGASAVTNHAHSRGGMGYLSMVSRLGGHGLRAAAVASTSTSTTPSVSTSTSTAPSATTPSQATPTQLQTDFKQLQTDLHAIAAKSGVTVAQEVAVQDDFQAIQKAATGAPSSATQTTLQTDLKALNGLLPTTAQKSTQLQTDYTALLNSEGVTDQTLVTKTITDLNAIVQASNVTDADLSKIIADRQAIATDLGTPSTSTTSSSTSTTTTPDPLAGLPFNVILGTAGGLGHPGGPMGGFGQGGRMGGFAQSGRMGGWGGMG
jgi:hypothetical protein